MSVHWKSVRQRLGASTKNRPISSHSPTTSFEALKAKHAHVEGQSKRKPATTLEGQEGALTARVDSCDWIQFFHRWSGSKSKCRFVWMWV